MSIFRKLFGSKDQKNVTGENAAIGDSNAVVAVKLEESKSVAELLTNLKSYLDNGYPRGGQQDAVATMQALARLKEHHAIPLLRRVLIEGRADIPGNIHDEAVSALGAIGDPAGIDAILYAGAYVLPVVNGKRALDCLKQIDPNWALTDGAKAGVKLIEATLSEKGEPPWFPMLGAKILERLKRMHTDVEVSPVRKTVTEADPSVFECKRCHTSASHKRTSDQYAGDLWVCPACGFKSPRWEQPMASHRSGNISTELEQFQACPNCGKTGSSRGNQQLNIFRCSCGKTYCDDCSGGGLIDLPRCPESPYHESLSKIGFVRIG